MQNKQCGNRINHVDHSPDRESEFSWSGTRPEQIAAILAILHEETLGNVTVGVGVVPAGRERRTGNKMGGKRAQVQRGRRGDQRLIAVGDIHPSANIHNMHA